MIGIDYSLSGPALTHIKTDGDIYTLTMTGTKKYLGHYTIKNHTIDIISLPDWDNEYERYEKLAEPFLEYISKYSDDPVAIEDYAMRALGRVFTIAEATYHLKSAIYTMSQTPLIKVAPLSVKKQATGKGNASKQMMAEKFEETMGYSINQLINCVYGGSPESDIVDSYWVAKINM